MVSNLFATRPSAAVRSSFSRALAVLYFARTAVSVAWVASSTLLSQSSGSGDSPGARVWVWLVLYPIADAVATAIDIRKTPGNARAVAQPLNLITSLAASLALVAATTHGFSTAIDVFGMWAIVSGSIQLFVALRRTNQLSAQWFMIISGAGSIFAGATFLTWHGTIHSGIGTLVQYSIGGAVWYLLAAVWMFLATSPTVANPARPGATIGLSK